MARTHASRLVLLVVAVALLASCGGDEGTPGSAPLEAGRPAAADLLTSLADRVGRGEGISDATWTGEVQEVGMALWPDDADVAARASRGRHATLAHIAGDMASEIGADELGSRTEWEERDPTSVQIYDAFVEASGKGVEAYRAWVDGAGQELLRERVRLIQGDGPPQR